MITSVQLSSLLKQSQSIATPDLSRQREDEDIHREEMEELKHSVHPRPSTHPKQRSPDDLSLSLTGLNDCHFINIDTN